MNAPAKYDDFAPTTEVTVGDCLVGGVVTGIRTSASGKSVWLTYVGADGERELLLRIHPGPHDGVLPRQSDRLVRVGAATRDTGMGIQRWAGGAAARRSPTVIRKPGPSTPASTAAGAEGRPR